MSEDLNGVAVSLQASFGFKPINLIEAMRPVWTAKFTRRYPGGPPYDHNAFRRYYSDHDPVEFRLIPLATGDDD